LSGDTYYKKECIWDYGRNVMISVFKIADMFNTVEFIPFILGVIWTIMGALGLMISVGWVVFTLLS